MGNRVAHVLEQHYGNGNSHFETLGRIDIPKETMDVRTSLAKEFKGHTTETGLQAELIGAIATASGDTDVDILAWLGGRTPLGITQPIVPRVYSRQHPA